MNNVFDSILTKINHNCYCFMFWDVLDNRLERHTFEIKNPQRYNT